MSRHSETDELVPVVEPKRRKVRKLAVALHVGNSVVELVAGRYVKAVNRIWGATLMPDATRRQHPGHPSCHRRGVVSQNRKERSCALPSTMLDAAIRIGLAAVLVYACGRIVLPFAGILTWSAILAVMLYPLHLRLATWLGNLWSALQSDLRQPAF